VYRPQRRQTDGFHFVQLGDYNNGTFTPSDRSQSEIAGVENWLDFGADNYAGITFTDAVSAVLIFGSFPFRSNVFLTLAPRLAAPNDVPSMDVELARLIPP